jgi:hypothetical protein
MTKINFETTPFQDAYLHQKLVEWGAVGRLPLKAGIRGVVSKLIDEAAGINRVRWRCEACKMEGTTEQPPERCPRCDASGKFYQLR